MKISIGQRLGSFEVSSVLGKGGMGEVWRATDSTLGREVALKALPEDFDSDSERHSRFEREAKVLASLNHPNIATLFGLEHLEGAHVLVMELVEGEGLDERIERGPISVDEAVPIALQIAEALEAAHEAGIVHRDLKPANIRIRPDGTVKVLDFGLAKAWAEGGGDTDLSSSPTMTQHATAAGVILGTATYMAPEQARGKTVDRRADIWSFGVVLWEMLTGRRLFDGDTVSDVLASVLKESLDLDALPGSTPRAVRRLIVRCLERDLRDRLQWIGDARLELSESTNPADERADSAARADVRSARTREWLAWAFAAIAVVIAVYLVLKPGRSVERPLSRFAVAVGKNQTLTFTDVPNISLSPDGRTLAFVASNYETGRNMIYLRRLDDSEVWPVAGTEGASHPFFSPSGSQIAFFSEGRLKKIAIEGGSVVALADAPNTRGGVWLLDETIVFSPAYSSGLWRVAASGGVAEAFLDLDDEAGERTYRFPDALPNGEVLVFTIGSIDSPNNYDNARIGAYSLKTGKRSILIEGANMARIVDDDTLIYTRGGVLYAIAWDPDSLETQGEATPVIEDVGGDPSSGTGYYAVAGDGTCAWVRGAVTETDALLTLVDRAGTATRLPLGPGGYHGPRFSPDGTKVAVTVGRGRSGAQGDVWIYSLETGAFSRATFEGDNLNPIWTPDGSQIAFLSFSSEPSIFLKPADGSSGKEPLTQAGTFPVFPESFGPRGKSLAYTSIGQTSDVFLVNSGEEPKLFASNASSGVFSPNGRWIAYASPGAGTSSVYVRPVEGEGMWQVSPGMGGYPRWSADGKRLFYIDIGLATRPLMEVDVTTAATFRAGPPRVVIDELGGIYVTSTAPATNWDTAPDGNQFIFVEFERDEDAGAQIEVALNWAQNLVLESN
ncbi:MAG: protein kinase [bacterium]|nr:protein kinase [bacterium]